MAVRSKRLFGPTAVSNASSVILYTCPAGETALIKHVEVGPGGIGGTDVTVYLNASAPNNRIHVHRIGNGDWHTERSIFWVLHPGDTLRAITNLGTVVMSGFGAELEGVAD